MNLGGMVAPMELATYQQVRPWAKRIRQQVVSRRMPPWHASPKYHGVFANERTLSEREISLIDRWVTIGAPRGDPTQAPAMPALPDRGGWSIGTPDLVVRMPEPFLVEDEAEDLYVKFRTRLSEEQIGRDRWVRAFEYRPDSEVVHHFAVSPFGGALPGADAVLFPDGYGLLLPKDSEIVFDMHYHKEKGPGTAVWDQSEIALIFWPDGTVIKHPVLLARIRGTEFVIPPGDPNYSFTVDYTFEKESLLMTYRLHMHLRGKSGKYDAIYPDGSTEQLLEVPRYDFNWQTIYEYREYKKIPAGTVVRYKATWDNSDDNPSNPDETKEVRFGLPTTAEMMIGDIYYVVAKPAHIVVGDTSNH